MLDEIRDWLGKTMDLARQIGDTLASLLEPAIDDLMYKLADVACAQTNERELDLNATDRKRANVLALRVLKQRSGRRRSDDPKSRHQARNTLRTARPSPVQAGAVDQMIGAALMV